MENLKLQDIPSQQSLPSSRKVINSNFEIVNATINNILNNINGNEIKNVTKVTVMNTNNTTTDAETIYTNGKARILGGIETSGPITGASRVGINGRDGTNTFSTENGNTKLGNDRSTHTFNGIIDLNGKVILKRRVYQGNAWDSNFNPNNEMDETMKTRKITIRNETVLNVSFADYEAPTQTNGNNHINRFELEAPNGNAGQIYYVIVHTPKNDKIDVKLAIGGTIICPLPRNKSLKNNELSITNDMQLLQFLSTGSHWLLMNKDDLKYEII
jgi:hypothetical protein